jgi:phosphatidylinositol alpha-1,6-mannosyltransferase
MKHLLVTNDFPPKVGGIQNLLWEWWRRLPPDSFAVLTSPHAGAESFDAAQTFEIRRVREPWLLPHPFMVRRINKMAREIGADFVVLDPAVPLGIVGPRLELPYMVVLHGAEVTVPGRLPLSRLILSRVLKNASHIIAAGEYPAAEARRAGGGGSLPITVIPPGVDTQRFRPLSNDERISARREFGVGDDAELIVGVSRLVPRKGFDTLIEVAAALRTSRPRLQVLIGGGGRDADRLQKLIDKLGAPVRMLGRVTDEQLPQLYGCADVSAMLCRSRWGGLEQEGFGIVFSEAASCGVPQIAGNSGGAADAVLDGLTGKVVQNPSDVAQVAGTVAQLLDDAFLRSLMGVASRERALNTFDYDVLTKSLAQVLTVDAR